MKYCQPTCALVPSEISVWHLVYACYLVEIDTDLDLAVGSCINIRYLCADNMPTMRVDYRQVGKHKQHGTWFEVKAITIL